MSYLKNFPFQLLKKLRSMRLSTKITSFLYLTSFLIFVGMGMFVYISAMQSANEDMISDGTNYCSTGAQIAENACSYLKGVADYCSSKLSVQKLLRNPSSLETSELEARIFDLIRSRNYILSIIFYTPAGTPIQYMSIDDSSGPISQQNRPAFLQLMEGSQEYVWEFIDSGSSDFMRRDNSPKLSLWRKVYSAANTRVLGVICVSIDVRQLLRYEMPYPDPYSQDFFLLDTQSQAVASDRSAYSIQEDEYDLLLAQISSVSGNFTITLASGSYIAVYQRILDTPLYIFYLVPDTRLEVYAQNIRYTIAVAIATYLLLIIPLITIVSHWLTRPLNKLRQSMESFSDGDFNIRLSFHTDDEIGKLGTAFNNMVEKNKQLIEQTYVAQIKAKEAELLLLQAQINPHFIYNLINSIQWSALRHGEKDIADTAYSLGQIFRISLNQGNSMITVARECDLVQYYLRLQKSRYRDRIQYELTCNPEAAQLMIPKLIIQPLVENAVVHGAEVSLNVTTIRVSVGLLHNMLVIDVEDDGMGIPADILEKLPDNYSSSSTHHNGFAIKNIYDRLKLIYNNAFTFEISSEVACGTSIHIEIPVQDSDKAEKEAPHV